MKDSKALVSFIMSTYNSEDTVSKSIESMLNQTYENIEILIVDDGSNDGTRELLQTVQSNNIKILYHSSNQGKGAAIKSAIKIATRAIKPEKHLKKCSPALFVT